MFASDLDMQVLAVLVAASCALPGVFLVLRRMALVTDAISHVILLGIVLAYFAIGDLKSPLLFFGAAASGVATVALVELLQRTRLIKEDAAIGLVYPALFSVAILLISKYLSGVHLDTDRALAGNLDWAATPKTPIGGGFQVAQANLVMGAMFAANLLFIVVCYKELKLTTFDAALAASLGFWPVLLNYVLMTLVSLTAVASFDAVGATLVVPLMVVPPAAAYLLSDRLSRVLALSVGLAVIAALAGFWLARWTNANFAGAITTVLGFEFVVAWFAAPRYGLAAQWLQRRRRRREFLQTLLTIHLLNHEGTPAEEVESTVQELPLHLRWPPRLVSRVVSWAGDDGLLVERGGRLNLTDSGRIRAESMFGEQELPKRVQGAVAEHFPQHHARIQEQTEREDPTR